MNKSEICKQYNITENQFYGKELIPGNLDLRSLKSIPKGFNPVVGGDLYLNSLTSIPEEFNPIVGGYLDLCSLKSIPKGFNPVVEGSLYLGSLKSIPEGFNPVVGGGLYLYSLTSIPEGFNPVVGGYLYLESLKSIPEGFNPVVGGNLYLPSLKSIPKGFNPICNSIYVNINNISFTKIPENCLIYYQDKTYIRADNIFLELIKKKGSVYKCKNIGSDKVVYIVTDGRKYSHGESIEEARESLKYKISTRDKSRYEGLKLSSKLGFGEMVECYRVITGACEYGVREFLSRKEVKEKKKYSIGEVVKMTSGEYGGKEFKEFFSHKDL
jgi:hypothetical protein